MSIVDLSTEDFDYPYLDLDTIGYLLESDLDSDGDIVPQEELEKVRLLLQGWEAMLLDEQPLILRMKRKKQRDKRKKKQAQSKGRKHPPNLNGKNEFLYFVEAHDCIKSHNKWKNTLGLVRSIEQNKMEKTKRGKKKTVKSIASSIESKWENAPNKDNTEKPKMTKIERKRTTKIASECYANLGDLQMKRAVRKR